MKAIKVVPRSCKALLALSSTSLAFSFVPRPHRPTRHLVCARLICRDGERKSKARPSCIVLELEPGEPPAATTTTPDRPPAGRTCTRVPASERLSFLRCKARGRCGWCRWEAEKQASTIEGTLLSKAISSVRARQRRVCSEHGVVNKRMSARGGAR
ncbi:hypothetical protein BDZ90DRAFT_64898 [Jaminaea rosea]|uniref:Uncharacterized protein n=1 Tax=Jaminaea rosea TaxID=1569628 RepID=A0A316UNC6_9BASI|nr:hypothetical protein BDZ90DRAFT_64898 [Jaminaea rosea]PWN25851.1 hypothetical protein BDZ90DRAFT_64898 [Jaminaea rosea]